MSAQDKISDRESLPFRIARLPRPIVFTNGCFDILHRGHVAYLESARSLGEALVVGVNDDASVGRLDKGRGRPINPLADRMAVLAALTAVDLVVPFSEDTPLELIKEIGPDCLVKGGDWEPNSVVGADFVRASGGSVHSIPIEFQRSTTELIHRIRSADQQ